MLERVKMEDKLNLKKLSDEELVEVSQKDIDDYRNSCYWECPECGHCVDYSDMLNIKGKEYIHESRCINNIVNPKNRNIKICNSNMILKNKDNRKLDSKAFDVLYERYLSKIKNESFNQRNADTYEEVYSILSSVFPKIVCMFARNGMKKTSDKWFSSFFWRSIKNRIIDIKKTNSYTKRTPNVICECCGESVGAINVPHLMGDGHENVLNEMFRIHGHTVMVESGEINYYDQKDIDSRAISIGKKLFEKTNDKKKFYENYCYKAYYSLYPNSYFKNKIMSTNTRIREDGEGEGTEVGDFNNENVLGDKAIYSDFISRLDTDVLIRKIANTILEKNNKRISNFFNDKANEEDKRCTIENILSSQISYIGNRSRNIKKDSEGKLSSAIMKILKEDKKYKEIIYSEIIE